MLGDESEVLRATRTSFRVTDYVRATLAVAIATGLALALRSHVDLADIAMIYLVAIAIAAALLGRGPSFFASVLSVAACDLLFATPLYTLAVDDLRHTITFAVMLASGIAISSLTDRIRQQSLAAAARERRTAALFALTRALAAARDVDAIARVTEEHVAHVFASAATLVVRDGTEMAVIEELDELARDAVRWTIAHGTPAGRGTDACTHASVLCLPLLAGGDTVAVLAVGPSTEPRAGDPAQRRLLDTFIAQIALAVERALLATEAQRAQVRAETEEMRSSLLSSVSHDLRTPLATILGSATMLAEEPTLLGAPERRELALAMRDEAARLERLVTNLLDMTRVESGSLEVKKEWIPLEELIGSVMSRFEGKLADGAVTIALTEALVAVDPVLFEQVLINLIENAMRHTPPGTPIDIRASTEPGTATIEVADRGPGLDVESASAIFDKFVRVGPNRNGVGLGLAICRGVVAAHGGTIAAHAREGGGVVFRVVLPLSEPAPAMIGAPEEAT